MIGPLQGLPPGAVLVEQTRVVEPGRTVETTRAVILDGSAQLPPAVFGNELPCWQPEAQPSGYTAERDSPMAGMRGWSLESTGRPPARPALPAPVEAAQEPWWRRWTG